MVILTAGVQSSLIRCCAKGKQPYMVYEVTKKHQTDDKAVESRDEAESDAEIIRTSLNIDWHE